MPISLRRGTGADARAAADLWLRARAAAADVIPRPVHDDDDVRAPLRQLWTFAANTGARRFYERHGFVATRRTDGDNEEGAPDILYVWSGAAALGPMGHNPSASFDSYG